MHLGLGLDLTRATVGSGGAAAAEPAFVVDVYNGTFSTSTDTFDFPESVLQEGDLLFCMEAWDQLEGPIVPSGFTAWESTLAGDPSMQASYQICGASPPASVTFTKPASRNSAWIIYVIRDVSTAFTPPLWSYSSNGNSDAPQSPAITPTVPNSLFLTIVGQDDDPGDFTGFPAGWSNTVSSLTTAGGLDYACIGGAALANTEIGQDIAPEAFTGRPSDSWRGWTIEVMPKVSGADKTAAPEIVFVQTIAQTEGTTITTDFDQSLSPGDVVIVWSASDLATFGPPSGYRRFARTDGGADIHGDLSYKLMGATPDTDITTTSVSNRNVAHIIVVVRGGQFDRGNAVITDSGITNESTWSPNPITTPANNSLVMVFSALDDTDGAFTGFPYANNNTSVNSGGTSTDERVTVGFCSNVAATAGLQTPADWTNADSDTHADVTIYVPPYLT